MELLLDGLKQPIKKIEDAVLHLFLLRDYIRIGFWLASIKTKFNFFANDRRSSKFICRGVKTENTEKIH